MVGNPVLIPLDLKGLLSARPRKNRGLLQWHFPYFQVFKGCLRWKDDLQQFSKLLREWTGSSKSPNMDCSRPR